MLIFFLLFFVFKNIDFAESCILQKINAFFHYFLIDFAKSKGYFVATGSMHSSNA